MPYVATDSGWNIGAPALWDTIRLDRLYRPIGGTVPSGFVTVGALSASSLSYTNP